MMSWVDDEAERWELGVNLSTETLFIASSMYNQSMNAIFLLPILLYLSLQVLNGSSIYPANRN